MAAIHVVALELRKTEAALYAALEPIVFAYGDDDGREIFDMVRTRTYALIWVGVRS